MLVAAAQINITLGSKGANLEKCLKLIGLAAGQGVKLVVFPECNLTGYDFTSYEQAFPLSEKVPGESTGILIGACRDYGIAVMVGLLERQEERFYNTAVLITPEGLQGVYRKTHLLCLGVDRFASKGQELPVFRTKLGKLAALICYDQRFPEAARVLALKGAQVILNPANLPEGAEAYANFLNRSRACENRVFIISANRIGEESGVRYLGKSQIVDYSGKVLAEGGKSVEELVKAEIIPDKSNLKHVINRPGEYEYDIFNDRRPELYSTIVEKNIK